MNTNRRYSYLQNLQSGDNFTFRNSKVFRNMTLVTASDTRCIVRGERMVNTPSGAESWEAFTDSCSPMAEVFYDSNREVIAEENKDGNETHNAPKPVATGKRGRRRVHNIELPTDIEFTVAEIAKKLNVDKYIVNNEVARIKKSNPSSVKELRTVKSGRGKPATVFTIGRI